MIVTLVGCGLENEVGQDGQYRFLPGAEVTDSALYPLRRMLWIEHDSANERALLYYFTGELSEAELGLSDLRRIAAGHGGFQMAFDTPLTHYLQASIEGHGRGLALRAGASTGLSLAALADDELGPTGAARLLSSTQDPDAQVTVYFGAPVVGAALPELELATTGPNWVFEPALRPLELSVSENEEGLQLDYGEARTADYLIVELAQQITEKKKDGATLDALVRTTLAPGAIYRVSAELLTDVAGKGCFSSERALQLRVTQVARDYERAPGGDSAVVHQHRDTLLLAAETWSARLGDVQPAPYCELYE